jgi:alpha-1,6-mannosyltransferase
VTRSIIGLDWRLAAIGACLVALSAAGAIAITELNDPNAGVMVLLQVPPYALAVWLVLQRPASAPDSGRTVTAILLVALAMRLLLLPSTSISTDLFRYIWDGRVQGAGINPYLYIPADAALNGLRDGIIYPNVNRADYAPTIYPPTAQIVFYLITRISESTVFLKAAMVAFEGLAVWAMLQLLAARGLPRARILIYAWHPLPLWEFARSGHVDIVAIAFLLLAFVAATRRSPVWAGIALGLSVLVKYIPIVTGPALYRRWDWRLPIALAATIVVLYLPYIGAGPKVLGFLPQYVSEERIDQGAGIFLWQLVGALLPLPPRALPFYGPLVAAIMLALGLAVALRRQKPNPDLDGAMLLAVTFTLLLSPHFPWYFAWLVPFLCFRPLVGVVYLTCAASYLYVFFTWSLPTLSGTLVLYGPAIILLAGELALRRRRNKLQPKLEERDADAVPA